MSGRLVSITLQQFCEHDPQPRELLVRAGFDVRENRLGRRPQREELSTFLRGAHAVLAGVEPYDAELLASLPELRCISRCGVGTETIDLEAAQRLGIAIRTTPDEVVEPVAQMTVAMMLALARNLPHHLTESRQQQWIKHTGTLLGEWTIGLIGYGRVGRAVARYLRIFGPRILVADPAVTAEEASVTVCPLAALLAESDLVSLHVARPHTEGPLMDRAALARMKRGSYLVNTARGFLVDEAALRDALQSGHVAGAALDVFESEPYAGVLATLPQVLCTPHVASLTRASRAAMELRSAQHIVECLTTDG